jgi:hypothetical protein
MFPVSFSSRPSPSIGSVRTNREAFMVGWSGHLGRKGSRMHLHLLAWHTVKGFSVAAHQLLLPKFTPTWLRRSSTCTSSKAAKVNNPKNANLTACRILLGLVLAALRGPPGLHHSPHHEVYGASLPYLQGSITRCPTTAHLGVPHPLVRF